MSYTFLTRSMTLWGVKQGRITRSPFEGVSDLVGFPIRSEPFEWLVRPVEGGQARFRVKSSGEVITTGVITSLIGDTHADEIRDAAAGHP